MAFIEPMYRNKPNITYLLTGLLTNGEIALWLMPQDLPYVKSTLL